MAQAASGGADMRCFALTAAALLCSFACVGPAAGQTAHLDGVVVDSATGAPLPGSLVTALDPPRATSAVTDGRGHFRLTGLGLGPATLVVTRVGYDSRRIDVTASVEPSATLEIVLRPRDLVLDPVQVTASRAPETVLDAPVSVSVVGRREIAERIAFTPADHIRTVPGMDFISTGLLQNGFAVRGRNGSNQGFLLMMADYRNAALPSIGSNVSFLLPLTSEDLERIEVVRGPGAALYGADAHRGVVHFVTRSPFESKGAALSLSGGERAVREVTARFAAVASPRLAFKVSGDYFRGRDWELTPSDEALRTDKGARRAGGEARLDWRLDSATTLVTTVGVAQAINVLAVTGVGPIQVRDWRYSFAQARLHRGSLFANVTYNVSDAGDTYQLRTGAPIVDQSRQAAAQLQRGTDVGRVGLLFGVDGRWTDPRTGGTTNGVNEDNDQVAEVGGYFQSRAALSRHLDFVAALRIDRNNRLDDLSVSPRAGLVFRPGPAHALRLTYNRAFSSPDPAQLFQDLVMQPSLNGFPYAIRLSSIPRSGYSFLRDCSGICMRSPFHPDTLLSTDATLLWDSVVAIMARPGPNSVDLSDIPPPSGSQVATVLGVLNSGKFTRVTVDQVADFAPLRRSFTQSVELGYNGVLDGRLVLAADAYVSRVQDPFGNSFAATPNVFHDSTTLARYLSTYRPATAQQLAGAIAKIPVGIISPQETSHPYDVLFLQRQGGAYTLWGVDATFTASVTSHIEVTGTYSWASKNVVHDVPVVGTIFLNVPEQKSAVTGRFRQEHMGLTAALQCRAIGTFPARTATNSADIPAYAVLDAHVGYQLSRVPSIDLSIDAFNLLDHRHREFLGGGELGRLVVSRIQAHF